MAYFNLSSSFPYKSPLLRAQLDALAENDQHLKDHGWQDGTKTLFYQASVPTGWTLAAYAEDRWLRVVSGLGGGGGGSHLASSPINFNHNHVVTPAPDHAHKVLQHWHDLGNFATDRYIERPNDTIVIGHGNNDLQWGTTLGAGSTDQVRTRLEPTVSEDSALAGGHTHAINPFGSNYQLGYADAIIGERQPSAGYVDMTEFFQVNQKVDFEPFYDDLRGNDEYNLARIAFGARHLLFNNPVPAGWQGLSAGGGNGFGLRAMNVGAGVGGGTILGTTLFFSHSHVNAFTGAHDHNTPNHMHDFLFFNRANAVEILGYTGLFGGKIGARNSAGGSHTIYRGRTENAGGGAQMGSAGNHFHSDTALVLENVQFAFVDVRQCEKLTTGAPFAYSLHPQTIQFKKLVSKQRLRALAQNDEHLKFHIQFTGLRTFFYQPTAPIHWTQIVAHDDKFLRLVNTAGGSGGTKGLSTTLLIEHTHAWDTINHQHAVPGHTHSLETRITTAGGQFLSGGVVPWYMAANALLFPDKRAYVEEETVGARTTQGYPALPTTGDQEAALSDIKGHTHALDTFGADINLAYHDVIMCEKG